MSLLANSNAIESGGYPIQRSLRFRSSASAWLSRTPATSTNRTTYTWSGWVKRGAISSGSYMTLFGAYADINNFAEMRYHYNINDDTLMFTDVYGGVGYYVTSTNVYRDSSAWYHVVFSIDTTQATAANRVRIYVNNKEVSYSSVGYPPQNNTPNFNYACQHGIGATPTLGRYFDGYLAEVNFIDGQALTPSSFGQTDAVTGVWTPKKYTGTYGTNGFYLPFSDNTSATTLAYDKSGNGNNWTPNNISTTAGATYDSMTDVPTLTSATAANYATLNPIGGFLTGGVALSNANLNYSLNRTTYNCWTAATFQMPTTGKWYFETQPLTSSGSAPSTIVGLINAASANNLAASSANQRGICTNDGLKISDATTSAYGSAYALNDIVQVAVDMDNGKIWFGKNGTWFSSGDPTAGTNAAFTDLNSSGYSWMPSILFWKVNTTETGAANFGQRPFSYTPPTGFKALNTFNLPDPTIKKPNQYMDATTYTGTGSALSVTNAAGFQPDFVWVKGRSGATDHALYDAVRGVQKQLESNTTTAETTETTGLTAFNSNGFSVGALAQMNTNTATYVGWQWKKGATPGFDIVTYTGNGANRTISHSLGVAPSMMIVKSRSQGTTGYTGNWAVWHSAIANTEYLLLNTTAAKATGATYWNSTTPTSSVFSLGTAAVVNNNNDNFVNYLFAEIAGFSKFGSYTGNGSTDGPFVYTNFQPRYILIKQSSASGENWIVQDTARAPYNNGSTSTSLFPDSSSAEVNTAAQLWDVTSNGFKIRASGGGVNTNGATYIYAAFASNPFKFSTAF